MDRRSLLQDLGLIAASAGITYWLTRPKVQVTNGVYVQMGSSITAGLHAPGAYLTPVTVGLRLNLTSVNVGFDGASAVAYERPSYDDISLCRLVDAVTSGNWSAQDLAIAEIKNGNEPSLSRIKTLDFNTVTYLGMEYGTNDFTICAPIEDFKKSLDYSIKKFRASFPKIHLFLMTPAWKLDYEGRDTDKYPNKAGIFLKQYADAMLEVASINNIQCLDMWRILGLNIVNYKNFTFDGTHPNEIGARIRGEVIASFISSAF